MTKPMHHAARLALVAACATVLCGCGLSTFYYLDAPTIAHEGLASSDDPSQNYVSFWTSELTENNAQFSSSASEFSFSGTAVYYKIYSNLSALTSHTSAIQALSSSSSAAQRLMNEGYSPLGIQSYATPSPLVARSGANRCVYIRLTDGGVDAYAAAVRVSDSLIQDSQGGSALLGGVPCRAGGSSFAFGQQVGGDTVPLPQTADGDATIGTFTQEGTYYVDLYAFSVGQDVTFVRSYSDVLHLGTVTITAPGS